MNIQNLNRLTTFLEKTDKAFRLDCMRVETTYGTVACAIGWSPEVFPEKDFKLGVIGPSGFDAVEFDPAEVAQGLYELNATEAYYLFYPRIKHDAYIWKKGDEQIEADLPLDVDATAKELAQHIKQFIEYKNNGWELLEDDSALLASLN